MFSRIFTKSSLKPLLVGSAFVGGIALTHKSSSFSSFSPFSSLSPVQASASNNGKAYILPKKSGPASIAQYPHCREVDGMLYLSGFSSRRADNTHRGAVALPDGSFELDIEEQTRGVIENMQTVLKLAGADLSHVVDCTCFLTDMSEYKKFNGVYNQYFEAASGPTRTTVAVKQLPHPNLLLEIKAIAKKPTSK